VRKVFFGFTLIEMLVTIAILSIVMMLAVPSFNDATLGSRLSSYANGLISSAYLARAEAVKRNSPVTLCVSANGATCTTGGWEQGWIVLATSAVLQSQPSLPSGLKITEKDGKSTIVFQPTGVGATDAELTVCQSIPSAGGQERIVTLSVTGRASIKRIAAGVCS
jgi:type IV fimbrial biogenesis protein FimT